jgi:hypothetical protein
MKTVEIIEILDEYLQEVNSDQEKRIGRIKELLDFLNYNLRLTELSKEEKEDFVLSNEGYPLNEGMRKTLDGCESEEKKNHYFNMLARSTYFRRCAWLRYLTGETKEKPILLSIK